MKTYAVILEHKETRKIQFVKIEDCVDMDDCINHIHSQFTDWTIERISPEN